jgi:hypothetical protein
MDGSGADIGHKVFLRILKGVECYEGVAACRAHGLGFGK